jgi:hypothetical protein
MTRAELTAEIELLRYQARMAQQIADSLDKRADDLRDLLARQETMELDFHLADRENPL